MANLELFFYTAETFLLLTVIQVKGDLFDGISSSSSPTANAVCFTSEDCRRDRNEADNGQVQRREPANQKAAASTPLLPLFCQNSSLECLCNRLQLHTHESAESSPLTNCVRCTEAASKAESSNDPIDPCTALDPYSLCNRGSGLCECSLTSQDRAASDRLLRQTEDDLSAKSPGSICLHRHLSEHYNFSSGTSAHEHVGSSTSSTAFFGHHSPLPEWMLSLLLAYLLPALVILTVVYFLYRQGCCNCGCGRSAGRGRGSGGSGDDSEMVLYRQL